MPAKPERQTAANAAPHPWRGYFYIAAATVFWGASATLGKAVFTGRLAAGEARTAIDPLILAQTRVTFSLLLMAPVILLLRGRDGLRMGLRDILLCMLLGVLGLAGSNYAYYVAIDKSTVATAIILQYTAPIWVLLYMLARGRQRATLLRVGAVGLAVLGCVMAIGGMGQAKLNLNVAGVFWAQVAAVSFAFYNIFGRGLLQRHERWRVLTYALLGTALFWMLVNPPWRILAAGYSGEQWTFLFLFAITSMLLPFSLYFAGLQHLDPTRAIVTSCLEPVFAIVFAAGFIGEVLDWLQVLGIVVVLGATIMIQMRDGSGPAPLGAPE